MPDTMEGNRELNVTTTLITTIILTFIVLAFFPIGKLLIIVIDWFLGKTIIEEITYIILLLGVVIIAFVPYLAYQRLRNPIEQNSAVELTTQV